MNKEEKVGMGKFLRFLTMLFVCALGAFSTYSARAGGDEITCEFFCASYSRESESDCMNTFKLLTRCSNGFVSCTVPDMGNNMASQYDVDDIMYTCKAVSQSCTVRVWYYAGQGCNALSSQTKTGTNAKMTSLILGPG